jgi:hypothetical protein
LAHGCSPYGVWSFVVMVSRPILRWEKLRNTV